MSYLQIASHDTLKIAVGRIQEADNKQISLDASKWGNSSAEEE